MDLASSPQEQRWRDLAEEFVRDVVIPAEQTVLAEIPAGPPWARTPQADALREQAKAAGLWNVWLPEPYGAGRPLLEVAGVIEAAGRSPRVASDALNLTTPDLGNIALLLSVGSPAQVREYVEPLAHGQARSAFAATEPDVASSDADNIATRIVADRATDEIIVSGTKWWSSGAAAQDCAFTIVFGRSNPSGQRHQQHSLVVVPRDTPGATLERATSVLGFDDAVTGGHGQLRFNEVRLPADHLVGRLHGGFAPSQARLALVRTVQCLKLVGLAERAFEIMTRRVNNRVAFGRELATQGVVQQWIARSRVEIDQARFLALRAAAAIDSGDPKRASIDVASAKYVVPSVADAVVDRAIQACGGLGLSQDVPLASLAAFARMARIADGPDEIHLRTIARHELRIAAHGA